MFGGQKELEQLGKQQEAESFQSQQLHHAMQRNHTTKKSAKGNCIGCLTIVIFVWAMLSLYGISRFTY